jgi:hypothetical protein
MIDIPMSIDLYYNTQIYFAKNILNDLPNDDREWADAYRQWLLDQGCQLVSNTWTIQNSLGVSPGYDIFRFHQEEDATAFILRWS